MRENAVERLSLEIDTKFRFDHLFDFLVEQEIDKKKLSRFQPVSHCGQRDMGRIESTAQKKLELVLLVNNTIGTLLHR